MDFLRAHHDAQMMGANTLREEPGTDVKGWDFGIDDEELLAYRRERLGLGNPRVIILTGSANVDVSLPVFNSPRVECWVLTTPDGETNVSGRLKAIGRERNVRVIGVGRGERIDLPAAIGMLRRKYGIKRMLCEGGPTVYAELLRNRLIDEDFRTLSLQVLGSSTVAEIERPTSYGGVSYTADTAPWFSLISLHYSLPHHVFLRLRYTGPRTF